MKFLFYLSIVSALVLSASARAGEQDALGLLKTIQKEFLPYGTVLSPVYSSSETTNSTIASYTHGADSAIWTGHLLAAESFHYAVTQSPEALELIRRLVDSLDRLSRLTSSGVLARLVLPQVGTGVKEIMEEEVKNGLYSATGGSDSKWIGNTSRDQYIGVFFGLSTAYELVADVGIRAQIKASVTRMLNFLIKSGWTITMPGRNSVITPSFKTNFYHRVALLQIGKQVAPEIFSSIYEKKKNPGSLDKVEIGIGELFDGDDHQHYYRFNLGHLSFYSLIHLESDPKMRSKWINAYAEMRKIVENHKNIHFDIIDHVIKGNISSADYEITSLLEEVLKRPRREGWQDLTSGFKLCGGPKDNPRACEILPISQRVYSDFLWQRSPFQVRGGGSDRVGVSGIDYILPYWMGRFYGIIKN